MSQNLDCDGSVKELQPFEEVNAMNEADRNDMRRKSSVQTNLDMCK